MKGEEGFDASFMAKIYPSLSRNLVKKFLLVVVEVSIVELPALFVTFGAENFVKGPAILLTEVVQNIEWTSNIDRDNAWKLGRIDEFGTLSGADEREHEEVRPETIYGFTEHFKRFATYSYPVPPAAELLWNRRRRIESEGERSATSCWENASTN